MPNSQDILHLLIHLLEEQEKVKITYTIENGTTSTGKNTNAAS